MNCIRYLGMYDLEKIDRLTIPEYKLLMKGYQLHQIDENEKIHSLAWANMLASQKRKNGKPVYRRFHKFFDKKKAVDKVLGKASGLDKLKNFIANYNSR